MPQMPLLLLSATLQAATHAGTRLPAPLLHAPHPCIVQHCLRHIFIAAAAAVPLQVNSETDFVARNEQFQGLVASAAAAALGVTALRPGSAAELEAAALAAARMPGGAT